MDRREKHLKNEEIDALCGLILQVISNYRYF